MFPFLNNISPTELIIIALILLIIFGAQRMEKVAKTGGETIKELKKLKKEFNDAIDIDDDKPSQS